MAAPALRGKEAAPALRGKSLKDPGVTEPIGWPLPAMNEGSESGDSNSNTHTSTDTLATGYGSLRSEATTVASRSHHWTSTASYPFLPDVVQEDLGRSLPKRFGNAHALNGMVQSLQVLQSNLAPSPSELCSFASFKREFASLAGLMKILDQVEAHLSSLSMPPTTPVLFRYNSFYTPCSLEVCVGQRVELCPLVSHPPDSYFVVVPKLPLGVELDVRSGLVHGRPREPTPGQVKYHVVAHHPARFPPKAHVAFIKLTVITGW